MGGKRSFPVVGLGGLVALLFGLALIATTATPVPANPAPPPPPYHPQDTPTPPPTCVRAWTNVASPNIGEIESYLNDVAAISTNDVWAVGYFQQNAGDPYDSLVDHWNGTQWVQVPSPNTGRWRSQLNGVAAVSANNVWAVGYADSDINQAERTLIEHWDGGTWSVVPSPNTSYGYNELNAITALSPNDIWAVGYQSSGYGSHTLIMHWNGSAWNVVGSPDGGSGTNILRAISALSPNDIWAVGQYTDPGPTYPNGALVLHWNGSQWSMVPTPTECDYYHSLEDVDAISANDVWAVGNSGPSQAFGAYRTLTMHWDGVQWDIVPSPNIGTSHNGLNGVVAIAPNDVWALGHYYAPDPVADRTQAQHWDGAAWSVVPSEDPYNRYNGFSKVSAVSGTDVWGIGYSCCGFGVLIEHYVDPCPPTPTPTPSGTPDTPTPPATFTPRPTCPPLPTVPPSPTRRPTPPPYPTYTPTSGVPSPTPTASPTVQPATGTVTPTPTDTPTSVATGTVVQTGTPTSVVTATPVASQTPCSINFSDVYPDDYFYEAVRYLYCTGAISGYNDNTFRPYDNATRAQLCKIVVLAEGWPIDTTRGPHFSDVPVDHPFYDYIETAYNRSVLSGYSDGTFRPDNNITRAQLSKIIVLAQQWPIDTSGGPHFSDMPTSNPFYGYIETAYNHSIITGYSDGTFRPDNNATRGQISKIVYEAITQPWKPQE